MDRDVGLEIAEKSHKDAPRVPGDGWFYGELSWEGMYDLISLAQPEEGDVFLDMGSGLGKIIVPNPSPPPTSVPFPITNSRTVTAATIASSISLGPFAQAEKSAFIRTSEFP